MRNLPNDVMIQPMPDEFSVTVDDDGRVLKATSRINGQLYELGLRPERKPVALEQARIDLHKGIWQLHELARLNRPDLMQYAHKDRHAYRKRLVT